MDDGIFMNVMRSPKICPALLELILPNEEIGAIRLKKSDNPLVDNSEIDEEANESMDESDSSDKDSEQTDSLENLSVETQKTLKLEADAHGVRFDAFVESSKLWADIADADETTVLELDKRARYYHANMDLDFLEQGQPYENLKPSYVIFICTFDRFNTRRACLFFPLVGRGKRLAARRFIV